MPPRPNFFSSLFFFPEDHLSRKFQFPPLPYFSMIINPRLTIRLMGWKKRKNKK